MATAAALQSSLCTYIHTKELHRGQVYQCTLTTLISSVSLDTLVLQGSVRWLLIVCWASVVVVLIVYSCYQPFLRCYFLFCPETSNTGFVTHVFFTLLLQWLYVSLRKSRQSVKTRSFSTLHYRGLLPTRSLLPLAFIIMSPRCWRYGFSSFPSSYSTASCSTGILSRCFHFPPSSLWLSLMILFPLASIIAMFQFSLFRRCFFFSVKRAESSQAEESTSIRQWLEVHTASTEGHTLAPLFHHDVGSCCFFAPYVSSISLSRFSSTTIVSSSNLVAASARYSFAIMDWNT